MVGQTVVAAVRIVAEAVVQTAVGAAGQTAGEAVAQTVAAAVHPPSKNCNLVATQSTFVSFDQLRT